MGTYIGTITYKIDSETNGTLNIAVKALNANDAFIQIAGKAYALCAGSTYAMISVVLTSYVPPSN